MKILYVLNSSDPGGMEYHALDLVKGMIAQGHDVAVWLKEGKLTENFIETGADITKAGIRLDIDPLYIVRLYGFIKKYKPDVIHAHELKPSVNMLIAAKLAGQKNLITHTHTPISQWPINPIAKAINLLVYKFFVNTLTRKEIALTEAGKQTKMAEGLSDKKLFIIPNCYSDTKFAYSPEDKVKDREEMATKYGFNKDKFVFGSISRLSPNKGIEIIIEAFEKLLNLGAQDVHLLLAGKGELLAELTELVESKSLQEYITFTGTFAEEDHTKLYNSMDCLVFHSYSEGFGLVMIEAMALRVPVLASDLPVLKEVGQNYATYFKSGDSADVMSKMQYLYNNYVISQERAEEAYQYTTNTFTYQKFIENYETLYKEGQSK